MYRLRLSFYIVAFVAAISLFAVQSLAAAQPYPSRPIRMIVPFPPGGANDILARILGQRMAENLNVNILVDNRPGASGIIGTDMVAKANADGYTVLMSPNTIAIQPSLYSSLPFDANKDLRPIALVAIVPNILVVNPATPVSSTKELIALANAKPGQLRFGSAGIGGSVHLAAELFKAMTRIDIVHIPYKGGGPALIDVLGGHIQMLFPDALASSNYIKGGRLRALGVTSAKRLSSLPSIPTISEVAVPGYESVGWYGVLAPSRTAAEVIRLLNAEITKALRAPDVSEKLAAQAAEPVGSTPQYFGDYIHAEAKKWAKVIKDAGIRVEQ